MLTFLFALFAIWTLFWFVMLMLDWGDRTPFTNSKALCATCAAAKPKAATASNAKAQNSNHANANKPKAAASTAVKKSAAQSESGTADKPAANVKPAAANSGNKSNVTPLFAAPKEKDDLKIIKGIGVVMEKTLNDLGITTFKQLAGFKKSDVQMVSERLSESNSGFGDRINRDEWVDQAKVLSKKAA